MDDLVTARGDGRARGLAVGEQLRDRVHDVLARVVESLGGPEGVRDFVAANRFPDAVETHTPDLWAELVGTAAGAAVPLDHLLAHNLMDESWWWSQVPREACSTLAHAGPPPLVGQTMDLDRLLDGSQVMVRHTMPTGASVVVLTSAGMVGLCGATSAGFAVCVNALTTLGHSGSGLPVAFALRGALAQADADAAIAFLRSVPHASGQHYAVVGHGTGGTPVLTSLECSARGAVPSARPGAAFAHANHPLASSDVDPSMSADGGTSQARQSMLDANLAATDSLDALTELLATAPICVPRTDGDAFTFGAIAVRLGSTPTIRYALGPPDATPWVEVEVA